MHHGKTMTATALAAAALVASGCVAEAEAQPPPPPNLLQVAGTQAAQLVGALDTGLAGGTKTVSLVLASRDEAGLDAYISGPHRPLSAQEYEQRFGPPQQVLDQVRSWAGESGLTVGHAPGQQLVQLSGPAQQVGRAFDTSVHTYRAGPRTYSAASAPATGPSRACMRWTPRLR